jgi:polar amino acid transport system substrate-binding protein
MRTIKRALILIVLVLCGYSLNAETIRVTLPHLPPVINKDKSGLLADLIRLMDQASPQYHFNIIGIYPFERSMKNVGKKADVHWPSLEKPGGINKHNITYSTETFYKVNFVLYTRKGSGIKPDNLKGYKIGTQRGQEEYFPFPVIIVRSLASGLKMVDKHRLDGLIFSMLETDTALKKTKLTTIDRQLYRLFNVKMVLSDDRRGKEVDKAITETMRILRNNGKYEKLMGFLIHMTFKK